MTKNLKAKNGMFCDLNEKSANHLNKISYGTIILKDLLKGKNCV
jgi:hypothetical protein